MELGGLYSQLKSLEEQHCDSSIKFTRHGECTLVFNAPEYINSIYNKYTKNTIQIAFGDYMLLNHLITNELNALLNYFINASLCFVFNEDMDDSNMSILFQNELETENKNNEDLKKNVEFACQSGYTKKKLPLPVLAIDQFNCTLHRMMESNTRISCYINHNRQDICLGMVTYRQTLKAKDKEAVIVSNNK